MLDPVENNPNSGTGKWIINSSDIIQGQKSSISANFVNQTRMVNYKNQKPDKNSELGNIGYVLATMRTM
ncbi:MAG: hypothetical protein NKF70_12830 [Methanobacterium sp. ERen5]|nr:MAG: hypothetical protein NKF70_12830 [Methanobacterium sp. ERen5]